MRIAAVLLAAAVLPTALVAQRWERQVQDRIDRAVEAVSPASRPVVIKQSGVLNTDEAEALRAVLVRGVPYAIIGVCDDDCSRLQLTLLKPGGSEITKERNSESLPAIHFTSDTTMTYGIRVVMEGCRWNPCWYAVAVVPLGKNPP